MNLFKQQLNLFYIALGFLTRIPVPEKIDFNQDNLNKASRYFSLVGWVVGLICALTFALLNLILPIHLAIVFSMLVSVLLTGCFHEDGLADTCDGFGGGWTQEQKLNIMKDSRLGTYGAVALWFLLTIKFLLLSSLSSNIIPMALLVAHPVSRSLSSCLIFMLPYVTQDKASKVKPLAKKQSFFDLKINFIIGSLALLLVMPIAFTLVISLLILVFIIKFFLHKQIQGFTGDTLGASQQIAELMVYLILLVGVVET